MPLDGSGRSGPIEALEKLDRVIDLLGRERDWCRQRLRTRDGRRCLRAALIDAEAMAELETPLLTAIRQVTGRDYAKVEMFNDQPLTTYELVVEVLRRAQRNLLDEAVVPAAPDIWLPGPPAAASREAALS